MFARHMLQLAHVARLDSTARLAQLNFINSHISAPRLATTSWPHHGRLINTAASTTTSFPEASPGQDVKPAPTTTTTTKRRKRATSHGDEGLSGVDSPYEKDKRQCILCKHQIQVDYKNPRLLSQFVSPLTGDIYDKHISGLCDEQQQAVRREIRKSRRAALMPVHFKQPRYNRDPVLFNPDRPQRPNPY